MYIHIHTCIHTYGVYIYIYIYIYIYTYKRAPAGPAMGPRGRPESGAAPAAKWRIACLCPG